MTFTTGLSNDKTHNILIYHYHLYILTSYLTSAGKRGISAPLIIAPITPPQAYIYIIIQTITVPAYHLSRGTSFHYRLYTSYLEP